MSGTTGSVSLASSPAVDTEVQELCDRQPAGGIVPFLRVFSYDSAGLLLSTTDRNIGNTAAYVVTGVITDCSAESDGQVQTDIRHIVGTAAQDLVAAHPGLQSASLVVLVGVVNVTCNTGAAVAVPAGVSLTWSTNDSDDSSLAVLSFVGAAGTADYILNATYKATAAG